MFYVKFIELGTGNVRAEILIRTELGGAINIYTLTWSLIEFKHYFYVHSGDQQDD